MPRKSRAAIQFEADIAHLKPPKLAAKQPDPPPPPPDLEPIERAMWLRTNREFVLGETAQDIYRTALEAHARSRKAKATIEQEGLQIQTRLGTFIPHPLMVIERQAWRAYAELMKLLKLRL